jgi:hypothetical protein
MELLGVQVDRGEFLIGDLDLVRVGVGDHVDAPLLPLTAAFFAGRIVSYTLYVTAASAAKESLGTILRGVFTSPLGIALQLLMLGALVALVRIDWTRILTRRSGHGDPDAPRGNSTSRLPS